LEVTGERSDERRQLPVALALAEAAFGVAHPGGTPAVDHLAVAPPLHVAGRGARDREHALEAVRVARGELAADTEPPDGEPVLEAFAPARRRIGQRASSCAASPDRHVHPSWDRRGCTRRRAGDRPTRVGPWEVVADVAALAQRAPLDERGVADHLAHRGGEGVGAVDHDQQPAVGVAAPGEEIGEQGGDDGLVSVSPHHGPSGTWSGRRRRQRHDPTGVGDVHAVVHQRRQVELGEVAAQQLVLLRVGGGREPAAHRRT
jgi:hypothetical protein